MSEPIRSTRNMGLMHKLLEQALKEHAEARTVYLLSVSIFDSLLQEKGLGDHLG